MWLDKSEIAYEPKTLLMGIINIIILLLRAKIQNLRNHTRGIGWSLRAVCLFLRARAVVKLFLRAASTLVNTDGEQRALRVLRKFSSSRDLSFINRIRCFAPSNS